MGHCRHLSRLKKGPVMELIVAGVALAVELFSLGLAIGLALGRR